MDGPRRSDYIPKADEARYIARDAAGGLVLRLVDAGDRLAVWSPLDGGGLLNPKGPGLRAAGLFGISVRGAKYHATAFRSADLRKWRTVEMRREPDNPHDPNAVALFAPGARKPLGYVQRGRAVSLAKRLDAGEAMGTVCMWGPGPRRDDGAAFILVASREDLTRLRDGSD